MYKQYTFETSTVTSFSIWEEYRKTIPVYFNKIKMSVEELPIHIKPAIANQIDEFLKEAMDTPHVALDASFHYFRVALLEHYNKAVLGEEKGINKGYLDQIKWKWKNPSTLMIVCFINITEFNDGRYRVDIYGLHSVVTDKDPEMKYIYNKLFRTDMIDTAIN